MRIALRASTGYLTAELGGEAQPKRGLVTANRSQVGSWEIWTVEQNEDGISLKSANGLYLCAESNGGSHVYANRVKAQSWERFFPSGPLRDGENLVLITNNERNQLSVSAVDDHVVDAAPFIGSIFAVEVIEADQPSPSPSKASRLHCDGSNLVNAEGQRVLLNGATFFAAPWLALERGHAAIEPSMNELRDRYGVNCLVEFCMSVNVQKNLFNADPCNPSRYGQHYFDVLGEHAERAAAKGQYLYLIVGPDHGLISPYAAQSQFRDFWNQLLSWARNIPNLILKPTNEGFAKGFNYVDVSGLEFPDFCPVAATDYGVNEACWQSGTYPTFADWGGTRSCGDIHPPRETGGNLAARECVALNNVYYSNHRPLFISEAIRLGSHGTAGVTRELARLVGAASNVGAAMRVFHSLQGEKCEVFDTETSDHADAYFSGK